jgi:para-aminobenzoate synthetase component 1
VQHGEPVFAVLGNDLFQHPLATVAYWDGYGIATGPGGSVKLPASGFDLLDAMLEAWRDLSNARLVGFLSYDLAVELEDIGPLPEQRFNFPRFHFGLYERTESADATLMASSKAEASRGLKPTLQSSPDRQDFEASVGRIVRRIHAGDLFQTNLCRAIEAPLAPDCAWQLYERMRSISPARFEAFLKLDEQRTVLSISPELFLKINDRVVESAPIKGTRARGVTSEEDQALLSGLVTSDKDRAELAMIVDVTRNDLSRVCEAGSVQVVKHAEPMTLPTVHHLVSTVRGRLRRDAGPVDLLRAAFPAASISGAPKIEAMRVALREEGQWRGPCMGAIGWIAMNGDMELSVAIRTAFVTNGRVRYYAGCGITADSVPETEFEESSHKAAAFIRALGGA